MPTDKSTDRSNSASEGGAWDSTTVLFLIGLIAAAIILGLWFT